MTFYHHYTKIIHTSILFSKQSHDLCLLNTRIKHDLCVMMLCLSIEDHGLLMNSIDRTCALWFTYITWEFSSESWKTFTDMGHDYYLFVWNHHWPVHLSVWCHAHQPMTQELHVKHQNNNCGSLSVCSYRSVCGAKHWRKSFIDRCTCIHQWFHTFKRKKSEPEGLHSGYSAVQNDERVI